MADPHLKSILERKCVEIELRIEDYRRRLAEAQNDLVHLNATMIMFARDNPKNASEPIMSLAGVFKRGEVFNLCALALQGHATGDMDTKELAAVCVKAKGLDPDDKLIHRSMMQMIAEVMQVRKAAGRIVSTEKRGLLRVWRLP